MKKLEKLLEAPAAGQKEYDIWVSVKYRVKASDDDAAESQALAELPKQVSRKNFVMQVIGRE